jgi:hypothetical protein
VKLRYRLNCARITIIRRLTQRSEGAITACWENRTAPAPYGKAGLREHGCLWTHTPSLKFIHLWTLSVLGLLMLPSSASAEYISAHVYLRVFRFSSSGNFFLPFIYLYSNARSQNRVVRGITALHFAVNNMSLSKNVHVIVGGISRQRASERLKVLFLSQRWTFL